MITYRRHSNRSSETGGAPGVDGMTVYELRDQLPSIIDALKERIRAGKYKPSPVRRVEIPKPDGGTRSLGVPTATDHLIQQAIAQVLTPIYERTFSDSSFGFRPKRSAHDAIMRAQRYVEDGYRYAVDLDLSKFFDTLNQDILMNVVRETIKDKTLVELIKRFVKAGAVLPDGLHVRTDEGTSQGGGGGSPHSSVGEHIPRQVRQVDGIQRTAFHLLCG